MKIGFHGADRNVTGSCHLVECNGKKILVDCGLYQGGREMDEENRNDFGFDPGSIDYLILAIRRRERSLRAASELSPRVRKSAPVLRQVSLTLLIRAI